MALKCGQPATRILLKKLLEMRKQIAKIENTIPAFPKDPYRQEHYEEMSVLIKMIEDLSKEIR